jgi:hypothetical protein
MPAAHGAEFDQFAAQFIADVLQANSRNLPEIGRFSNFRQQAFGRVVRDVVGAQFFKVIPH